MENVDIFKEMTMDEIKHILAYFDKLKLFFEGNEAYLQRINDQLKLDGLNTKGVDSDNESSALNNLLKLVKQQGFDYFEAFDEHKNIQELYQEMTVLSLEGRFVSGVFRKYKLKLAKSLLKDTTEIVEAYRVLAQQNPGDKRIQDDYKKLEAQFKNMNQSVVFDDTIIDALNQSVI
jgi:predicted transcriptional regulator with HTH domain